MIFCFNCGEEMDEQEVRECGSCGEVFCPQCMCEDSDDCDECVGRRRSKEEDEEAGL